MSFNHLPSSVALAQVMMGEVMLSSPIMGEATPDIPALRETALVTEEVAGTPQPGTEEATNLPTQLLGSLLPQQQWQLPSTHS